MGVAAKCRSDLLTDTCTDKGITIAAWITNPNSIENPLQILLAPDDDDATMVNTALGWADEQISQFMGPATIWDIGEHTDRESRP